MVNLALTTALKTRYASSFMDIPAKEEVFAFQKAKAAVKPKKRKAGEDEPHIDRPGNAFFIFRQWMSHILSETLVPELIATYRYKHWNTMWSKVVGYHWSRFSEDSDVKTFWNAMQEEAKERHAEAHPGYKFRRRAKAVKEPASKKRKTKRTKSSASVSSTPTGAPQTPVWDTALKNFQFTFQVVQPSVASPRQSSPTSSSPVNEEEQRQAQGYYASQHFVNAPSQPEFYSTTAPAEEGFYGPENAIAGPSNLYTPERSYSPDEFDGDAFVQDYDSVTVELAEQVLSLCSYTFPAEAKYGVNFDDLEPDDELITSMPLVEQDVFALRLNARAAFRQWQTYDL